MKHAREDYDRIQDPAGLIPDDEPVFLLRGQDMAAPNTVLAWADENDAIGGDPEASRRARTQAVEMRRWQSTRAAKRADLAPPQQEGGK